MTIPKQHHRASLPLPIVVNGRYQTQTTTGVQRYAIEIVSRLGNSVDVLVPKSARGAAGHLWEQTMLPSRAAGRLLWCPNACGPLNYGRQVVTFHDLFPVENPEWYSTAYARWYGVMMRRLAAKALHLIAVSEYTRDRVAAVLGRSPEEITVIHNGCNPTGPANVQQQAAARSALKLPGRRYVLSLGSLESRKNVKALLEAWTEVQDKLPQDLWLVLAGARPDTAVFGKQAEEKGIAARVFYTGYVPEEHLRGLYSGAELFVFPSLAEGFGLPLLEAMSCGVRCLSSNTTSLPEVGGDAVRYFDPGVRGDLPLCLLESLTVSQRRSPVGYGPSLEQASRFSWDIAAQRTRNVLQRSAEMQETSSVCLPEGMVGQ